MVGGVVPDPMSSTEAGRLRRPGFDSKSPPAEPPGRRRRLWSVLPVCAGFAVFGAVVWMAYQDASLEPPGGEPPLIKAAPEAIKLPPDQAEETALAAEQGEVGHLWSDADEDQPERLLPLPEQPLSPPAGEPTPTAGQPSHEAPGGANSDARVAALPSAQRGQGSSDAAPEATPDRSLQEAEAALDRLLAEVTAVSEGAGAQGQRDAKPAEDTNGPTASAAAPPESKDTAVAPPENEDPGAAPPGPAASSPRAPAAITAAAEPPIPAAPPAPPQKPARAAPATTAESEADVRPAGAVGGGPSPGAQPRSASTETAALTPTQTPPIVADGDFRIQLAAVQGQADARRAWELFARDLGPTLSGVEPIFERADTVNGVFYRVQIGPFARQEAAESLCEQLKQHNASCFVIRR
jgi:SPOR domain